MFYSKELLISPYTPNTVIGEWTTPQTTSITLKTMGIYEITAFSGGAGGMCWDTLAAWFGKNGGGTGAYYKGTIKLLSGTYTVKIGGGGIGSLNGSSSGGGETSIVANGIINFKLTGASGVPYASTGANAGGSLTDILNEKNRTKYTAGLTSFYNGAFTVGDRSIESSQYGIGGGAGDYYGSNGTGGYLKIVYKGR